LLLSAYICVICQVAITHSLSVNCHVSGRGPIHSTRLSHKDQVSVSCQITNIGTIPVTCQLHLKSCPDHLSNYKYQLTANSLSLSMLNLRHPLVTWHIANKCRIPGTCHVTPLHPPVICHPCIPLSSVTPASPCHLSPLHLPVICHPYIPLSSVIPASYPPVICHTINARKFLSPVMLHLLHCRSRYLSCCQHTSNSCHFVMLHLLRQLLSSVVSHTSTSVPVTCHVAPPAPPCFLSYNKHTLKSFHLSC